MTRTIDFVKGHCGWDVVTLVLEGQVPADEELACSIKILELPVNGGLEVGWLGRGERPGEIRLRMVNSTTQSWIPMCGGMTQVIGKALVETFFRDQFDVDLASPTATFDLITDAGIIPIRIDIQDGKARRVTTVMDNYIDHVHEKGIVPLELNDIPLLRVGKYAVIDIDDLERKHPGVDFTRRDPGIHLEIVNDILRSFRTLQGVSGVNGMLFDQRPEGAGQYRVFPRFYSEDLAAARIPWEFQCGTGSIVVAAALAHKRKLPISEGRCNIVFEWGSYRSTPDPYGIRLSELELDIKGNRLVRASFSHSVVEILAEGALTLPGYASG